MPWYPGGPGLPTRPGTRPVSAGPGTPYAIGPARRARPGARPGTPRGRSPSETGSPMNPALLCIATYCRTCAPCCGLMASRTEPFRGPHEPAYSQGIASSRPCARVVEGLACKASYAGSIPATASGPLIRDSPRAVPLRVDRPRGVRSAGGALSRRRAPRTAPERTPVPPEGGPDLGGDRLQARRGAYGPQAVTPELPAGCPARSVPPPPADGSGGGRWGGRWPRGPRRRPRRGPSPPAPH